MNTENILVPFDQHSKDLRSLYHAFSLAERIKAKVFVLFFKQENDIVTPFEKACMNMIQSACEEEMSVSFHIANDLFQNEILNIINTEHIDLIVISAGDSNMESSIKAVVPKLSVQVIKVEDKNNINLN